LNDVIHVEARFRDDGEILPLAFVWEERRFAIFALGRQWQKGLSHHFLVMTSGEKVFEITYNVDEGNWHMGRSPAEFERSRQAV